MNRVTVIPGDLPAELEALVAKLKAELAALNETYTVAAERLRRHVSDHRALGAEMMGLQRQFQKEREPYIAHLTKLEAYRPMKWLLTKEQAGGLVIGVDFGEGEPPVSSPTQGDLS